LFFIGFPAMKSWGVLALGFDGVGEVCLELLLLRLEGRIVRVTVLYQYIIGLGASFSKKYNDRPKRGERLPYLLIRFSFVLDNNLRFGCGLALALWFGSRSRRDWLCAFDKRIAIFVRGVTVDSRSGALFLRRGFLGRSCLRAR
jgi:hypothetical protein